MAGPRPRCLPKVSSSARPQEAIPTRKPHDIPHTVRTGSTRPRNQSTNPMNLRTLCALIAQIMCGTMRPLLGGMI